MNCIRLLFLQFYNRFVKKALINKCIIKKVLFLEFINKVYLFSNVNFGNVKFNPNLL